MSFSLPFWLYKCIYKILYYILEKKVSIYYGYIYIHKQQKERIFLIINLIKSIAINNLIHLSNVLSYDTLEKKRRKQNQIDVVFWIYRILDTDIHIEESWDTLYHFLWWVSFVSYRFISITSLSISYFCSLCLGLRVFKITNFWSFIEF